jgi:hypothetical protein
MGSHLSQIRHPLGIWAGTWLRNVAIPLRFTDSRSRKPVAESRETATIHGFAASRRTPAQHSQAASSTHRCGHSVTRMVTTPQALRSKRPWSTASSRALAALHQIGASDNRFGDNYKPLNWGLIEDPWIRICAACSRLACAAPSLPWTDGTKATSGSKPGQGSI